MQGNSPENSILKLAEGGNLDAAYGLASELLRNNPWNLDSLFVNGEIARAQNNLPLSLELYERAALLSVTSVDHLFLIGAINKITGNHERGNWVLGEVLRRDPTHTGAKELLATNPQTDESAGQELQTSRHILVYPGATSESIKADFQIYKDVGKLCGIDILPFPIPCEGGWWPFEKLDRAWESGYAPLMAAYEELSNVARTGDILIAAGGSMMHPDFVKGLPSYNVFLCGDDPESSNVLSKPVAPSFDFSLTMNIACVDDYKAWGCKNAAWIFCPPEQHFTDSAPTETEMLMDKRPHQCILLCERIYGASDRAARVEYLLNSVPETVVRGKGWPGGFVSTSDMIDLYKHSKVGWNLHNSIGPTNSRTYSLPMMGVMQICDNKSHLGKIFELDREVVGFDSLEECVEKTRYYIAHEEERKEIAFNGWSRANRDYTIPKFYNTIHKKIAVDVQRKRSKAL